MAKDKIHYAVKIALENDGWQVTDDPLVLFFDDDSVAIDLGAEKLIIAEKGTEKIAIEIKAFNQPSVIYEFHRAIGQYFNYQTSLLEAHENRKLYHFRLRLPYFSMLVMSRLCRENKTD